MHTINQTEPDGKKLHPEDNDSGTVALIAIFAASAILIILSVVCIYDINMKFYAKSDRSCPTITHNLILLYVI